MDFSSLLKTAVLGVTSKSKKVVPGGIFVAIQGVSNDGHFFIDEAIANGALFIVSERPAPASSAPAQWIQVENSRKALSKLSAYFYRNPSREMKMVGVTGTSGKTTSTFLIESILQEAGLKVGVIGTIEIRFGDTRIEADQTTPSPEDLQRVLREMSALGCDAVVMEVSSHALLQNRVDDVEFDSVVFTNLSPEHLDYHPTMEEYYQAKKLLFKPGSFKKVSASIGTESEWGRRLYQELQKEKDLDLRSFSLNEDASITFKKIKRSVLGIEGEISNEKFSCQLHSKLIGEFNALNILGAVSATRFLNLSPEVVSRGIEKRSHVPGRMEWVENKKGLQVLVDYAHKPDALEKVLETLRSTPGVTAITTVFGCGGDRDRTKRSKMGEIAERLSDRVIVTSDNPRTEDPKKIIEEILSGFKDPKKAKTEPDRAKAIEEAIRRGAPGEVVLIAGKGHETYQILPKPDAPGQTYKIRFDDREIARNVISRLDS